MPYYGNDDFVDSEKAFTVSQRSSKPPLSFSLSLLFPTGRTVYWTFLYSTVDSRKLQLSGDQKIGEWMENNENDNLTSTENFCHFFTNKFD